MPHNTNIKQSIFFFSPFIAFDQLPVITSHFVAYAYDDAVMCIRVQYPVIGSSVVSRTKIQNEERKKHEMKCLASVLCLAGVCLSAYRHFITM